MDEKRIEELAKRPFFRMFPEKVDDLRNGLCTFCNKSIGKFKNEISRK